MSSPASLRTAARGTATQSPPSHVGVGSRCTLPGGVRRSAAPQVREARCGAGGRGPQGSGSSASAAMRSGAAPRCVVQHDAVGSTATGSPYPHCYAATSSARRRGAMSGDVQKLAAASCVVQCSDWERRNRLQCSARNVLLCSACIAGQSQLGCLKEASGCGVRHR